MPHDWRPKFIDYAVRLADQRDRLLADRHDAADVDGEGRDGHAVDVVSLVTIGLIVSRADQHPLRLTRATAALGSSASACAISSSNSPPSAPSAERAAERRQGALAVEQPQPQPPEALPRAGVARAALGGALGGLLREVVGADVFVDARGEAVRGGAACRRRAPSRAPRARPPRACRPARTRASSAAAPRRCAARRRARR